MSDSSEPKVLRVNGNKRIKVMSCNVVRLVPYDKMMAYVRSLDIGSLHCVKGDFCYELDDCEKVESCYRHLAEFLPLLAKFYFKLAEMSKVNLLWFKNEINKFHIALGGDGVPYGKESTACFWLVSFLNRGKNILRNNENFMIFRDNCEENSIVVYRNVNFLLQEIIEIEKKVFDIDGKMVTFTFSEFPNDLKMMAFLAGELPVSAKCFSTFANVNTDNCVGPHGNFGSSTGCTLQPWSYSKRVSVSKKVEKLKKKLEAQNCSAKTRRNKITALIANEKSRQEFEPLLGRFLDRAHIEPLHVRKNACQQMFRLILYESVSKSNLGPNVAHFNDVSN